MLPPLSAPRNLVPRAVQGDAVGGRTERGGLGSGSAAAGSGFRAAESFGDAEGGTFSAAREPQG